MTFSGHNQLVQIPLDGLREIPPSRGHVRKPGHSP
jgi:hypothetical protein